MHEYWFFPYVTINIEGLKWILGYGWMRIQVEAWAEHSQVVDFSTRTSKMYGRQMLNRMDPIIIASGAAAAATVACHPNGMEGRLDGWLGWLSWNSLRDHHRLTVTGRSRESPLWLSLLREKSQWIYGQQKEKLRSRCRSCEDRSLTGVDRRWSCPVNMNINWT